MVEVELKVKIKDIDSLLKNLTQRGYLLSQIICQEDLYYNGVDRDFRKTDEALRIRTESVLSKNGEVEKQVSYITYKGQKLDSVSMSRKELETEVIDCDTMNELLIALGYRAVSKVIKKREEYMNTEITDYDIHICIDHVEGLGDYLEIEICTELEAEREKALAIMERELEVFGYSMQDTIRISYLSMLEAING